jgi:hypothetical protein
MGSKPHFAKVIAVVGSALLILSSTVTVAAEINWTTLTSLKDVRRMRTFHDSVYIATGGGLLIVTDPNTPGKIFDNLSGLQATDLTDIIEAADGQKWVVAQGRLIKFGITQSQVYPFFDTDGNSIRLLCLADDGDNLWVGTSIGLVLFSKINDGGQIQDSYVMFGALDPSPAVNDILLVGDSIWLATSAGVAVADRRVPTQLKVPSTWKTWGPGAYPELGTAQPRRVVLFESQYYVGTSDGLFQLDRTPVDTLAKLAFGVPPWVTELKIENDSLFIYLPDGLGVLKSGAITLLGTFGLPIFPVNGTNTGSYRWLALLGETGIYENSTGTFTHYAHTGLPATAVRDVVLGNDGMVTGLFKSKRVYQQTDSGWISRPFGGEALVGALDSSGIPWVGTEGNGLWRISTDTTENFDETNSSLRGNNDQNGSSYVFVRGLAINSQYIFATAFRALNGYPVAFGDLSNLDSPSGWDSLGISDGLTDAEAWCIDIFGSLVAVGTRTNGLFVIDLGPNPRVKSDDTSIHYTTSLGPLIRDDINSVKFSPEGDLWVGTSFGVSRLLNGYPRFSTVNLPPGFGPEVNAIEFDPRGNVWLGAANGVARFDAAVGAFEVFTTQNSGLVNDNVYSIRYEARTGDVYIATDGGLSIARSLFGKPTSDVNSVLSFPNPFVINSSSDILRFNFSRPGTVRILTVAGARVAEIRVGDGWNGANDSGKPAASGVYFFVITSDVDGAIGTGKFLLVRNR